MNAMPGMNAMLIMLNTGRAKAHEPGLATSARIGRGYGEERSPWGLTKAAIALRDIISRRAAGPPGRRAAGHECAFAAPLLGPPGFPA